MNNLIEILKSKMKPNLNDITLEELTQIYIEYTNENNSIINILEKYFSSETLILIQNIFDKSLTEIKNKNILQINKEDLRKKILIDWINNLWKNFPLLNNDNEIIDCIICLNNLNNTNYMIFECEHITHSSCFINYLFSNLKNSYNNDSNNEFDNNNLIKLFRCPNCRNYLTEMIKDSVSNINTNITNNISINNIDNVNYNSNDLFNNPHFIDDDYNMSETYGDEYNNFILWEYNLINNSIDNNMLSNIFRISNQNMLGLNNSNNIINNINSNIIINYDSDNTNYSDKSLDFDSDND